MEMMHFHVQGGMGHAKGNHTAGKSNDTGMFRLI